MDKKFKMFVEEVIDIIPSCLEEYDIENVTVKEIVKNNGVICTGLVISVEGELIAPNIYLKQYYNLKKSGTSMDEIIDMIVDDYKMARERIIQDNIGFLKDDEILENVFIKLVNYDRNKDELKKLPHIIFHDLAVTFRYFVSKDDNALATTVLRFEDLERLGYSLEEMFLYAKENTRKVFSPKITRLDEILLEHNMECPVMCDGKVLYVLTNDIGINGAAYMLWNDILRDFAHSIDSNFFILPSSIHEVLLLPETDDISIFELRDMVSDINKYVVSDMEILSDNVYYYNLQKDVVEL